jgi:2-iminobutanoate/2-iminopropanoate deaminase
MKMLARNPTDGVYAATSDYVHAMEVQSPQRFLFISGTMGLAADGAPGADLDTQLKLIWSNIRTILASAAMTTDNIVRLTSYLRDPGYADANGAARVAALGQRRVPTTAIVAQTLSSDWLVEIEVVAAS